MRVGRGCGLFTSDFWILISGFIHRPPLRLRAEYFQFSHGFAAQAIQFAHGNQHVTGQKVFQFAKFERRATEATELFPQLFFGERKFFRLCERHRGFGFRHVARFITNNQSQRLADSAVNFHADGPLKSWCVAGKTLAQTFVEFRVVSFPNFVADVDAQKINVAVAETQFSQFFAGNFETWFLNFVNASAFFLFIRFAGIENNSITKFDGRGKIYDDAVTDNFFYFAEIHAALFAKARVNKFLIVVAAEPAGEQAARKRHFQIVTVAGRNRSGLSFRDFVQRGAINARDARNVFGRFQSAFNFQRRNSGTNEFGQNFEASQVLRAQ